MTKKIYEKGTIKIVWIEKKPEKIFSKMFTSVKSAEEFGKNLDNYIIFKLLKQKNMRDFKWEVLPYGKHRLYFLAVKLYQKYGDRILKILNRF